MADVSRLLRESKSKTQDVQIRCRVCESIVDEDVDLCPYCGEPVRLITLSELGKKLPIGVLDTNSTGEQKLLKDFNVSRLDWVKERAVAETWKTLIDRKDQTVLDYILCILANTVTDIGGVSLSKHDVDHRIYIIGEMFAGDVFYMYAYLRVHSIGNEFQLKNVKCPSCGKVIPIYEIDLSTIEVLTRDDPNDITHDVILKHGFKLGGELRKKITLQPASFRVVSHADINNDALFFADVLKSSCTKIDGVDGGVITDTEIEQMSPYDLALVRSENDFLAGGVDWSIDITCQKCSHKFTQMIDWRYGHFFALSSRSKTIEKR
jgi:hypothetical protein